MTFRDRAGVFRKGLSTTPTSPSGTVDVLLSRLLVYTSWQDFTGGKGSSILKNKNKYKSMNQRNDPGKIG